MISCRDQFPGYPGDFYLNQLIITWIMIMSLSRSYMLDKSLHNL